jgi:leucyl/phenylalanyl-tRNA--protein transferase
MSQIVFPPLDEADENGLLAFGGSLTIETLLTAYSSGIFPWPISGELPMAWFSPDPRGVIDYDDLKVSKRLARYFANTPFQITFNQNFEAIIMNCAKVPRKHEKGTWITRPLMDAYINLHRAGFAFSVEVHLEQKLVGGLYGTYINGVASGESMYCTVSNASKYALVVLMERLHTCGIDWLDTQMTTTVVDSLGGKQIAREDYIKRLNPNHPPDFFQVFPTLP